MIETVILLGLMFINTVLLFNRTIKINICHPGKLLLFYWLVNFIGAFIVFNNSVDWKIDGLIYLLICVDLFCIVSYLVIHGHDMQLEQYTNWEAKSKDITLILMVCFGCGLGYNFLELANNGFSFVNISSTGGLKEVGDYFTDGRYTDNVTIVTTTCEQIFLTISYSGILFAGFLYRVKKVHIFHKVIQFVPVILCMMYSTAKTPFICGVILFFCGFLLARTTYANKSYIKIKWGQLFVLMVGAFILVFASFMVRYGADDLEYIFNRIIVYAIGHVPTYGEWFDAFEGNWFGYSYGWQTFRGLTSGNMPERLQEVYYLPRFETKYSWTNVVTLFAFVIMDYGYLGSILFWILFGIVASLAYVKIRSSENFLAFGVLGLCYFEILYSFLISALKYKSIMGAFVMLSFYIWWLKKIKIEVN